MKRAAVNSVVAMLLPGVLLAADEGHVVTRWTKRAMHAVRTQGVGTPDAARLYAMLAVAMYDAVNGIDVAEGGGRDHAVVAAEAAAFGANREMAAASAAHAVLTESFPALRASLDMELEGEFAARGGDADARTLAGRDWGAAVGRALVRMRAQDGTQQASVIPAGSGPGAHRAPFDSRWKDMAPFGVASISRFLEAPAPGLGTAEYASAFNEVKALGKPDGDSERDLIANFWLAESGTVRETGIWLQAAIAIVRQHGTIKSISDTARLLCLVGMAVADSVAASWRIKATYLTWRPAIAIREAESDGNFDTAPDVRWRPRSGSVGASPEYNSGTSAFAAAASKVIEEFYGRRVLPFCFETDGSTVGPRCFVSPSQAAEEAGLSRILQGIHFRFSSEDGRRVGAGIGAEISATRLLPR
jgi:hypothetical protein